MAVMVVAVAAATVAARGVSGRACGSRGEGGGSKNAATASSDTASRVGGDHDGGVAALSINTALTPLKKSSPNIKLTPHRSSMSKHAWYDRFWVTLRRI